MHHDACRWWGLLAILAIGAAGVSHAQPDTGPATSPAVQQRAPRHIMPVSRPSFPRGDAPAAIIPSPPPKSLTDEDVGRALQHGVDFLVGHFQGGVIPLLPGADNSSATAQWQEGLNALCVYALVAASRSLADDRINIKGAFMKDALDQLKRASMERNADGSWQPVTYGRGLRAAALAVYARKEDRDALKADAAWLVRAQTLGGYTYDDRFKTEAGYRPEDIPWDNSNSQYGTLGVWSSAEVGAEVPSAYWRDVERHWAQSQLKNGQWAYKKGDEEGSLAMTAAGVASLFVTTDWLGSNRGRDGVGDKCLAAGLAWLEAGDHCAEVGGPRSFYRGYDLFSIERVALACGFKEFGTHDWYRELGLHLVQHQWPDGSWGGSPLERDKLIETAYDVLFLARGRQPILLNKLRFAGNWSAHPRDAANFTRYAARELERGFNWQVVNIDRDWTDWTDTPLLYLASATAPNLTDGEIGKLREFVEAGGLLFTHADAGSTAFNQWVKSLAAKLWPNYSLHALADDDDVYSLYRRLRAPRFKLQGVSNGSRLLLVHSPTDIALAWQQRAEVSSAEDFQLGMNLFLYTTGKDRIANRLAASIVPPPGDNRAEPMARLRYAGWWNPEPAAWKVGMAAKPAEVDIAELDAGRFGFAHLTGTAAYTPTEMEIAALRHFVESGGVLLIDDCGGHSGFGPSVQDRLLSTAFPNIPLRLVSPDDPLLHASAAGMIDLPAPRLRPCAAAKLGDGQIPEAFRLRILHAGRGIVVFSPLDLTTGLTGSNTWGMIGYEPAYARQLVRNIFAWSLAHRPRQ